MLFQGFAVGLAPQLPFPLLTAPVFSISSSLRQSPPGKGFVWLASLPVLFAFRILYLYYYNIIHVYYCQCLIFLPIRESTSP